VAYCTPRFPPPIDGMSAEFCAKLFLNILTTSKLMLDVLDKNNCAAVCPQTATVFLQTVVQKIVLEYIDN